MSGHRLARSGARGSGRPAHVVVLGDALLDVDLVGTVERLCPDAPAPVVQDPVEHARPGGAALAAALAAADGCEVTLVTAVCDDAPGRRLVELLAPRVRVVAVPAGGTTPVKRRVRVAGQTLLRLDTGSAAAPTQLPDDAVAALDDADAVLVSDYGRGLAALPAVHRALEAVVRRTPVVWDPHPRGGPPVRGARLVTPNLAEAALATGSSPSASELAAVGTAADALVRTWGAAAVAVTLGERGALLSYGQGAPSVLPAAAVRALDPCGAGDRFASAAAVVLAGGGVVLEAVEAGVRAATAYVADGGASAFAQAWTAPSTGSSDRAVLADGGSATDEVTALLDGVRAAGGTVVATGGCFDLLHAGHVATLSAARALGDCLVVCLNSDDSVRRLKGAGRPLVPAADRAQVLGALACVDAVVVFEEDTPEEVLGHLRPDVWAKGGDYRGVDLPEQAVLGRWGGVAVVLPYLDGRSTTQLVRTAGKTRQRNEEIA